MKFILIMTICSSTLQICTPEKPMDAYKNWFECSSAGYLKAYELNKIIGIETINNEKTIINFKCQEIKSS